jgi:nitroreductase
VDALEAIKTRRSVTQLSDKVPSDELIGRLIDAARWAPNHFNTQPWRFVVLSGEGRNKLGDVYGKLNQQKLEGADEEKRDTAYRKGLEKAKRSPVIIVVTVEPSDLPKVKAVEEIAATAAAVQNLLLAAHALGLAAKWRTGDPVYTDVMKEQFGVSEKGTVLGLIYLGYPEEGITPKPPIRKSAEEMTTWIKD